MIIAEYSNRSIFTFSKDHILVCTVNCFGVMGKGIALDFAKKWPNLLKDYKKACGEKRIELGKCWNWKENDTLFYSGQSIICYPTKLHWKNPSKYEYIEKALPSFLEICSNFSKPIVVPKLGCGCGKLNWKKVKEIIFDPLNESFSQFIFV